MENKSENILTTVPIHLQKKAQTDPKQSRLESIDAKIH